MTAARAAEVVEQRDVRPVGEDGRVTRRRTTDDQIAGECVRTRHAPAGSEWTERASPPAPGMCSTSPRARGSCETLPALGPLRAHGHLLFGRAR